MQKQFLDNAGLAELLNELGQYLKSKLDTLTFDTTPTANSTNPVTSGGVKAALDIKADKTELPLIVHMDDTILTCDTSIADIYMAYSVGRVVQMKIADLSAPLSLVSSSNNSAAFAVTDKGTSLIVSGTNESDNDVWTVDSFVAQEKLTFDSTPTTGSQNPVTSNGIKTALDGKLDALVSGTNIKTINNTSLLGDGNISMEPNEIASITTTESTASGGNNTVTINTTDGTSKTFNVKNGTDGKDGQDGTDGVSLGEVALVQTTGDSEESVMSQKAVTEYGRKVTAEDLAGTSEWIREKLTEEGWKFGKYINTSGNLADNANCCVSAFIPISMSERKGHSIIFNYMYYIYISWCVCFYDSNKTYISGLYYQGTETNTRTVTLGTGDAWDNVAYARYTFNSNKLLECSVYDNTTKEYIWRFDEYIVPFSDKNLIDVDVFRGTFVSQEEGTSKFKVMSQDALSGLGFANRFKNNIISCKGITTTNQTYRTIGLKLNDKQKQLLEDADTITIRISSKKFWESNNYAGVQGAFWFVYNSAGGFAGMTSCGINNALATLSNVRYYPDHLTFVIDMVNGVVKTYWEKTLLNTFTNDGYKKENVLGESGILKIFNGNTQIPFVLYQFDVYDGDITPVFGITQMKDYLSFDSLSPIIKGNYTQTIHHGQMAPSTYGTATGYTIVQASASSDGHKHITSSSSTTWYPAGYYISHAKVGRLTKYCVHIEVVSGAVQIGLRSTSCNSTTPTVVNETTGETVTASNVGVGTYKVIGWGYGVDTWCLKYVSGDPMEVIIKNTDYHLISCVISLDCRNIYNGQLYDKEVGIFYPKANMLTETLSSGRAFVNPTPSFEDFNPIGTSTSGRPGHTGQFAIASDKAYISVNKDTWKQITNT